MKIIAELKKPYEEGQRIDFIVNYNHSLGYKIEETDEALQALDYDDEEKEEQLKQNMRSLRNSYLVKFVDPKQLVLVWNSLSGDKQKDYIDYRQYLLDYPQQEEWWKIPPMDFDTWKESTKPYEEELDGTQE